MKLFVIKFGSDEDTTYKTIIAKDLNHFIYFIKYLANDDLMKKIFQYSIWGYDDPCWNFANKIIKYIVYCNNGIHINWKLTNLLNLKNVLQKISNDDFIGYLETGAPNDEWIRIYIIDQDDIIYAPLKNEYNDEIERIEDVKKMKLKTNSPFLAFE